MRAEKFLNKVVDLTEKQLDKKGISDDYVIYWDVHENNHPVMEIIYPDDSSHSYDLEEYRIRQNEEDISVKDIFKSDIKARVLNDIEAYRNPNTHSVPNNETEISTIPNESIIQEDEPINLIDKIIDDKYTFRVLRPEAVQHNSSFHNVYYKELNSGLMLAFRSDITGEYLTQEEFNALSEDEVQQLYDKSEEDCSSELEASFYHLLYGNIIRNQLGDTLPRGFTIRHITDKSLVQFFYSLDKQMYPNYAHNNPFIDTAYISLTKYCILPISKDEIIVLDANAVTEEQLDYFKMAVNHIYNSLPEHEKLSPNIYVLDTVNQRFQTYQYEPDVAIDEDIDEVDR